MGGVPLIDLAGRRFGKYEVLSQAPSTRLDGGARWYCRCDCGEIRSVKSSNLRSGHNNSCESCRRAGRAVLATHGATRGRSYTVEFSAWANMKSRCKPDSADRQYYFDRGIGVCDQWIDDFEAFLAHVGKRPTAKHSLDRIDTDKGYEPGNVRWALPLAQSNNRRKVIRIEFAGEPMTLSEIEAASGGRLPASLIRDRLKRGWAVGRALEQPKRIQK